MSGMLGKSLIIIGILIVVAGLVIYFKDSIPLLKHIGRLPGDIVIKKENFTFYFPLGTSILISIILSLFFIIINRMR